MSKFVPSTRFQEKNPEYIAKLKEVIKLNEDNVIVATTDLAYVDAPAELTPELLTMARKQLEKASEGSFIVAADIAGNAFADNSELETIHMDMPLAHDKQRFAGVFSRRIDDHYTDQDKNKVAYTKHLDFSGSIGAFSSPKVSKTLRKNLSAQYKEQLGL